MNAAAAPLPAIWRAPAREPLTMECINMTKHQPFKDFDRPSPPACRVADLGLRFATAFAQWNALDGNPQSTKALELTNELAMEALNDVAVFEEASSPLGALYQLCIVSGVADRLSDLAFEANEKAARADMVRIESALWSIRRFIEGQFGVSAVRVGGEYMMPESTSFPIMFQKAVSQPQAAE